MIVYAITKTISIDAAQDRVFTFLADAANWPKWAIVNVLSVKPTDDHWWEMETPSGMAKLRIRPNADLGTLDHDFNSPDASWTVPARLVSNGSGCEFMITFFQPPSFSSSFFEEQVALVDRELAQLKMLMEMP
ncbi:hypothetical protein [Cyanobium sp. N5-Cardenillas]|uniref:hypothetical protein n=1 Tax=Cyanobium sp. N5-Cardenillas TaxID=2823720 RepID=UPI0020CEB00B|nr:hypothetical protein [Cyanobium sp. N5-Cardenillas]MCP9787130.1 hypothetical protein [Cyanobium sp. N5-Cardenillas]